MRCDFKKDTNLIRAYAIYVASNQNLDQYKAELQKAFNNPEDAEKAVAELVKGVVEAPFPKPQSKIEGVNNTSTYRRNEESDNIASYYIDGTGFMRMESKFSERLLKDSILNIDKETGRFEYIDGNSIVSNNITLCQENIVKFKEELINSMKTAMNLAPVSLTLSTTDIEYTQIVSDTLNQFSTYLETANQTDLENSGVFDSYVILKNFDRLLDKHAAYVRIDKSYKAQGLEGISKYNLAPKVDHYFGFSGKDESADIMHQISNLAETILKLVPEVEENGHVLETSSIGMTGFSGAMQALKTALLYTSDKLGDNTAEFRKAFTKGEAEFLNPNSEYNIVKAIDAFIEANKATNKTSVGSFSEYRQVYLHNKLRGIQKYLLADTTPSDIKNMFSRMFFKTETTGYRAYSLDKDSHKFVGKDLKSKMVLTQKFAIQNVVESGLTMLTRGSRAISNALLNKYNITITPNFGGEVVVITNKETGHNATITYGKDNNGNLDLRANKMVETNSPEIISDFMIDAFSYIIPDTYATCISSNPDYNWADDFAPFVVLAAKEAKKKVGLDSGVIIDSLMNAEGEYNLSFLNSKLLAIGERLGVIYGDSIKSTIKSLSGSSLPLFQLTSLEYNWRTCLDDAKTLGDLDNPQLHSIFWDNEDLLLAPQIRSEVEFGKQIKAATELSLNELNKLGIVDDFFIPFLNNTGSDSDAIYLQNATFSDKARQFLPGYKLNTELKGEHIVNIYGEHVTLKDIITDALKNPQKLNELTRRIRRDKYIETAYRILMDYDQAMPEIGLRIGDLTTSGDDLAQKCVTELQRLDKYLLDNNISLNTLRTKFAETELDFKEELHAYQPKANIGGKARVNETFLAYLTASSSPTNWKKRINANENKFAYNISSVVLNGFTYGMRSQIEDLLKWGKENGVDNSNFYNNNTREFRFVGKDNSIHPIARAYFATDVLLSNEFNSLTIGEIWAHPNKNKDIIDKFDKTNRYLEFSEASRLVNQIKRSVIFGSTIHPFAQGIKNDKGYEIGVTPEIEIAIIEDEPGKVYTPNGVSSTIDSQDGSGLCTALQANLENNSEIDAAAGMNKKTIVHDIDHRYGTATLLKWAVYALTNDVRRNGRGSVANVENLVARMYGKEFDASNLNLNLTQDYQDYLNHNSAIWIKNLISGNIEELVAIELDENGNWVQKLRDNKGNIYNGRTITVKSLYDIDQLFGGAWTFAKDANDNFIGTETSADLLTNIAIKYNLRDKQIAYAVNASACKVGATNLNSVDRWTDGGELKTYKIHTKYAGIMMDADHELKEAEVTEMSQMISALIEDGHYTELVTNIYNEIGEIAFNNDKIQRYIKAVDVVKNPNATLEEREKNRKKVTELLSKSLIESFESGNKDTIGLAQAFIKRADIAFKNAAKRGEIPDYKIPFSDGTIFRAFVADVTSKFNKDAIRRKYEGYAGVLNPSHNMIEYYLSSEGVKLFNQFNDECREHLKGQTSYIENMGIEGVGFDGETHYWNSWQEAAANSLTLGGEHNPYLVEVTPHDIDFEDSIVIKHIDGTIEQLYVNNFATYDELRNLRVFEPTDTIFKNTAKPRNLRGTDTTFTVKRIINGIEEVLGEYSYYNIDSVRAAQYITQLTDKKYKPENDPYYVTKVAIICSVFNTTNIASILASKNAAIEACNVETQNFLEKLDLGQSRTINMNMGEEPSLDDIDAQFNHQACFGEPVEGAIYYASSYNVRPAEIIMGRYQMEKLGLDKQDHIWQIKDASYFEDKLKKQFTIPDFGVDQQTLATAYDKVLYHNGKAFLVKIGEAPTHGEDGLAEYSCPEYNVVGNNLRFESNVILINEDENTNLNDRFRFSTLSDGSNNYTLITVNNEEDFDELQSSDFFDNIYRNNIYKLKSIRDRQREGEKFSRRIERLAKDRFESYKQAINYVGARIPTQAMQSFMPFTVVAFTDTDKNQVYVPKANTHIEGSDYDIDKLYLLAATILSNGSIQSGSAIQNIVGFKTASQLFRPNGIQFVEAEVGFPIKSELLAEFSQDADEWTEETHNKFVFIANQLGKQQAEKGIVGVQFENAYTNQEQFEFDKIRFLNLLNKHSHTKSYLKDSADALKTRVFSGIRRVTLSAQNQLKAQITVDTCTSELKDLAAKTKSGDAEKRISPDIPSSKYLMQEQNMLGKAVVGIGAVSLKTYFILSTSNNRKCINIVNAIQNGDYETASQILNTMTIISPMKTKDGESLLTTIANTNLNSVLKAAKRIPEGVWDMKNWFIKRVETLQANTAKISAPEFLSGIISLAADNAKDLALPKLNATSDLVDIYTTAAMLGVPFKEMFDIMTSDVFGWMTKAGANNIFDDATLDRKVKNMVGFMLNPFKDNFSDDTLHNVLREYNKYAEKQHNLTNFPIAKDIKDLISWRCIKAVIRAFEAEDGLIQRNGQKLSQEEADQVEQDALDAAIEAAEEGVTLRNTTPLTQKDWYNYYRIMKLYENRLYYLTLENKTKLETLEVLLEQVEEMSTLGQQAGINQGLKTNLRDFYNFGRKIEDFINRRLAKTRKNKKVKNDDTKFEFRDFLLNEDYAQLWIAFLNNPGTGMIKGFNILEALHNSPNFFSMSKIYPYADDCMRLSSSSYRMITTMADKFMDAKTYLSENDFKELDKYVTDLYIYNFFKENDIELNLETLTKDTNQPIERYTSTTNVDLINSPILKLDSPMNIASFKHIMESVIIPTLKVKYKGQNAFLDALCLRRNSKLNIVAYTLPIQMMDIDANESTIAMYSKYLKDFNALSRDSIGGQNIGGLFFLYNLITNKNSFGQQSLTRIFEDLVDSVDSPKVITAYYDFISNVDSGNIVVNYDIKEAAYRLAQNSRGTKVTTNISKVQLPEDFTLELPLTGHLNDSSILNRGMAHTLSYQPLKNMSTGEVLEALADGLNKGRSYPIIYIVDDEEVAVKKLPNARGFVSNGAIYLNKDRFKDNAGAMGVGLHEVAHLVLAAIKAKPADNKLRQQLYTLMYKLKSDADYNDIAALYPDRVGSDLDEEVLCTKIEKILANRINSNSEIEVGLLDGGLILGGLKTLFDNEEITLEEAIKGNLEYAIEKFAYTMFDMTSDIELGYTQKSQVLADLKNHLLNSSDTNNKLEQDCK